MKEIYNINKFNFIVKFNVNLMLNLMLLFKLKF